jgi:hypothetical protein
VMAGSRTHTPRMHPPSQGRKMLCTQNFYSADEFWKGFPLYNHEEYRCAVAWEVHVACLVIRKSGTWLPPLPPFCAEVITMYERAVSDTLGCVLLWSLLCGAGT